ncbi:hypothetical protein HH_1698 [Helicobacter hepaticus ATCC 51449]|uniref:Uncharacterized protein n=1 Tax=Helicobacter hepaticus (strain ATCC 51449 / 3B1) TaxID=235279 RepID=Q7VFH8_HELHP|nr:hypothetical protein HH_1698 [Helicobacter hepaticus ATCC 51449]
MLKKSKRIYEVNLTPLQVLMAHKFMRCSAVFPP